MRFLRSERVIRRFSHLSPSQQVSRCSLYTDQTLFCHRRYRHDCLHYGKVNLAYSCM